METFEVVTFVILLFFGLGLAVATIYLCLGVIGLIFLIPQLIASAILGFIGAILGGIIIGLKELALFVFRKLLGLVGFGKPESYRQNESGGQRSKEQASSTSQANKERPSTQLDPYQILQLSPGADRKDIKAAYLKAMSQYHPDKVSHLGNEFQTLAEEKAKQIQHAYSMLRAA